MDSSVLFQSGNLIRHKVRAKYIPQSDGELRLACVQSFNQPRFRESGWEEIDSDSATFHLFEDVEAELSSADSAEETKLANIERASRRAKINAFDMILCNPDLDTFATFTYRPQDGMSRSSYDDCYKILGVWLSNSVQRNGLKYVIVPEYHKSGDIHFHGIVNSAAVKLERAISPNTGRALSRHGLPIYNITNWRAGFSTAQIIGSDISDRDKVAKYIFKYMGKQCGQRIGGRYALIGGKLVKPVYAYGEDVSEFIGEAEECYHREVTIGDNIEYKEYSFI